VGSTELVRGGVKISVPFLLTSIEAGTHTSIDNNRNRTSLTHRPQRDALRGSIDLLVLKTLSLEPMHAWGICQRIQQISKGELEANQGSLYPALQRLEKEGLVVSDWGTTDNNRQARYYRLTASGKRALGVELESWQRFAAALNAVLRTT
jgi:PadR family transcriptional regulator, regulatory protein PadR